MDSLQHIHIKLDMMAKHLGISSPGHKAVPSLICAHRGSDHGHDDVHGALPDAEHHQQMDNLISQVDLSPSGACIPKLTSLHPLKWTSHLQCAVTIACLD